MGDRYYYDYRGGGRARGRSTKWNFFFPFLLLIIIGVVLVLAFQLFRVFFPVSEKDAVYMYVANGSASIKIWGTNDFARAYSGTQVLQGDEVMTSKDSKVVVKVFDGTLIRLAGDTHVTFNEIFSDGGKNDVQVILHEGEVWINKTQATSSGTEFILTVGNLNVSPIGTVFDVEKKSGADAVRVMYGTVSIDVNSQDGGTAVDHIDVEEGNEATFDQEKMAKFWAFQAPNVVTPLSEDFKTTPWYAWNVLEDEAPTDFAVSSEAEEARDELPASGEVETGGTDIAGVVPSEDGVISGTTTVIPDNAVTSIPADEVSSNTSEITGTVAPVSYGSLTAPKVLTVNGVSYTASQLEAGVAVDTVVVKVEGEIMGAEKVFVNSYQLQKFIPSSGKETFIYWANANYTNMKPGENTYTVYGVSPDGTKSPIATFKLIYTPKEEPKVQEIPVSSTESAVNEVSTENSPVVDSSTSTPETSVSSD